jgi:poly(3-hydroxybutyrate) depolymerase
MKQISVLILLLLPAALHAADVPEGLSAEDFAAIQKDVRDLKTRLTKINDHREDADIFLKGILWALRYDTKFTPPDVALIKKAVTRAKERVAALEAGKKPWAAKKGKLTRGYISAIDGSTQPFGLVIPAKHESGKPIRLDVVLHGSTRPVGMSELRFMNRFDEGDEGGTAPDVDYIELHPLGRVENCYRWAGETDVFEAIDAVCKNYALDRNRIVLRGMSMGASGTWHLGLKHPDRFVALGPYCGYVDTYNFSKTPGMKNFVKVENLPSHQAKVLHMLDSIDYAANANMVPAIAAMGEKDPFFDAHVLMGKAMDKEGLKMVNLLSPGTGHVIDPATHKEQMRRIGEYAAKGIERPKRVRFKTWTLKYSSCHWIMITGMKDHYQPAEVIAEQDDDGLVRIEKVQNVTSLHIGAGYGMPRRLSGIRIGKQNLGSFGAGELSHEFQFDGKRWTDSQPLNWEQKKRPGLQGPIDDAFTSRFLCVRGTGKPWNPAVDAWAQANLKRFAYEWNRYFRGDLPVKDDKDVTKTDRYLYNLILFGDPGSNSLIGEMKDKLPIVWTPKEITCGKEKYAAESHVPALICRTPDPFVDHYVVINSGHTFHEKELAAVNYLLFPRLGDYAILKVGGKVPEKPSDPLEEEVIQAGFFNEDWKP